MIQKVMPALSLSRRPLRSSLKIVKNPLNALSGSSLSGWNAPRLYPTEMIIPDGLTFKEKAYYLLKGRLPKSVYERWLPNDGENIINQGDELVTVNKTYEGGVVNIVEGPHDAVLADGHHTDSFDISGDDMITGGEDIGISSGGGDDMSTFEIWKHLAGLS